MEHLVPSRPLVEQPLRLGRAARFRAVQKATAELLRRQRGAVEVAARDGRARHDDLADLGGAARRGRRRRRKGGSGRRRGGGGRGRRRRRRTRRSRRVWNHDGAATAFDPRLDEERAHGRLLFFDATSEPDALFACWPPQAPERSPHDVRGRAAVHDGARLVHRRFRGAVNVAKDVPFGRPRPRRPTRRSGPRL